MQIGDHTYFDIEITGYDRRDFIGVDDVLDVEIVETAGTSLPFIYVSLISSDADMLEKIVQGNTFKISIGENKKTADTFEIEIYTNNPPNTNGTGARALVEFGGYVVNTQFMVNKETNTYFGNSLLVAKKIIKDYFGAKPKGGFLTNISKVNENQITWRQTNETTCLFLAETLCHMDIRPSFPLFSFDKYGNFHLRDFDKVAKGGALYTFVARPPEKLNEIQYFNSFNVEDFRETYNLYSGYNKITEVWGVKDGMVQYAKSYNEPILASTKEVEMLQGSSTLATNKIQSANVHNTYVASFVHNTNKLVGLSAMEGCLQLAQRYYNFLKPTDIVYIKTGKENPMLDGLYVIDSIRTQIDMERQGKIMTYVYVTRDNRNNIENALTNRKKGFKINKKFFSSLMNAIGQLRVAYATAQRVIDGTYMKEIMSFAIETKRNLLRSFTVAGVGIDFNSSASLISSLVCTGNSLMNTLTSMIFPSQIADTLRDFIIRKPTLKSLLSKYIAEFVPVELRSLISLLADSLFETTNSLNSIARENGVRVTAEGVPSSTTDTQTDMEGEDIVIDNSNVSEINYTSGSQERVQEVVNELDNNSSWLGLDIPFPIIDLTESQALMPNEDLKRYVANQTIVNLTNLGYMTDLTTDEIDLFREILIGEQPVEDISDVNLLAQKININAGNTMNYRYWGSFNDLTELTSFFIKKSYKDKYRTIPCTKLINATQNSKIFFACPSDEVDLRFYINSKRQEVVDDLEQNEAYAGKSVLGYFPIELGYVNAYGASVPYTVYYTNLGYNSNSVLFEVKRGGI